MTITINRQMRVVTQAETLDDDALTVAAVRELAWAMNNFKAYVSGPVLISTFSPDGADVWAPTLATTEKLVHKFAPRPLPHGYDEIWFQIAGQMSAGDTGYGSFRLYSSAAPYSGRETFDQAHLGPPGTWAVSSWISITSTTHQAPAGNKDLVPVRNGKGETHLTLTCIGSVADEHTELSGIYAQARGAA